MLDEAGEGGFAFVGVAERAEDIGRVLVDALGSGEGIVDFGLRQDILNDEVAVAFKHEAFVFGHRSGLGERDHGQVSYIGQSTGVILPPSAAMTLRLVRARLSLFASQVATR